MTMRLQDFLLSAKSDLTELKDKDNIHLVIGNESCDLDSVVAACTLAYFKHKTRPDTTTLYMPLLSIPRDKFKLRLEVVYFLLKHGISSHDLTFKDDLDLDHLVAVKGDKLRATLVDHHVLTESMAGLRPAVVEVLDHHPQESELPDSWSVENERVGSCCTLIGRRMLTAANLGEFVIGETEAELLLGTILTDTGNLSTQLNLATPADRDVVSLLQNYLPTTLVATQLFEEIRAKKFDLSSLTVLEMLYKDCKFVKGSDLTVVMSSITMPMEDVISRPEFVVDTEKFLQSESAAVLVMMTLFKDVQHIAVVSPSPVYRQQITDVLLQSRSPNLDLRPFLDHTHDNMKVFLQGEFVFRKGVLPLIRDYSKRINNAR